jgi:hypothetical protein
VNTNVMVTQDGTTIDAQDIHGFLTIAASNVRVTRTIVRGPSTPYTQNAGVIRINSGSNILIEDVEIAWPRRPRPSTACGAKTSSAAE